MPTYNELKRLPKTLEAYFSFFNKKKIKYEIIISDISSDGTKEYIKKLQKKHKNLVYLELKERGKGLGVYKAFEIAKGELVSFVDADNSTPPEEFYKLFRLMNRYDAVIGSRGLFREHAINYQSSLIRKLFSFCLSTFYVRFLYGLKIKDSQCGAKIFKKKLFMKVKPELKITNAYFDIELLWRYSKVGTIKELPVKWTDAAGTHFKWKELYEGTYWLVKTRLGF